MKALLHLCGPDGQRTVMSPRAALEEALRFLLDKLEGNGKVCPVASTAVIPDLRTPKVN